MFKALDFSPDSQAVHSALPVPEYFPTAQVEHDTDPLALAYFPAPHDVHAFFAVFESVYLPGTHFSQLVVPTAGAYFPFGHVSHVVDAFALLFVENFPVGQATQVF